MPDEKIQIPPARFAVREFTTPNFADGFYTEVFKRTDPAYLSIQVPKRGTLYSTIQGSKQEVITQFPNLYFLKETRLGNSHEWVVWLWASDPAAEDSYNAEVTYAEDQLAFPTFKRPYTIRRDVWDATPAPVAMYSPLSSLVAVQVGAQGSNYTPSTTTVSFSGGSGSGAAATAIIAAGKVISIVVNNGGTGYTSAPTVTINSTSGGSGATATALIQPQGAIHVRQVKQEFPPDSPFRDQYVRVIREYRTLPGPVTTEYIEHPQTSIPLIISNQEIAANTSVNYTVGTFQPPAVNVSSISTGATVTVTLASNHGLPVGAWVTFAGTNSTPNINGLLQIVGTPALNQVQVTPAAPVTIAGTAAGTMVSKNQIQREIKRTENGNVDMKVETIVRVPDVSVYNEDIQTEEDYPYPDHLKAINLYRDAAKGGTVTAGDPLTHSFSLSGGAAVGIPIQAGYRGPNPGSRRKRFFFVGTPPDSFANLWTPTIVLPSEGTFQIESFSLSYSQSADISDPLRTTRSSSTSNSWRTGVIPPVTTGPSPSIADASNIIDLTISNIGTGSSPIVTVPSTTNLTTGDWVTITGSNSIPAIDGVWQVTVLSSTTFRLAFFTTTVTTTGSAGNVAIGAAISQAYLDLPESNPPLLVASLNIQSITTGAAPVVTLSGTHYWKVGQYVEIAGSNSTPSLDGIWRIATVPGATQITLVSPPTISGAGTVAGTANGFITIMEQPQKLEVAGLWQCYVKLIKIRYTSGQVPI